MTTKILRVFAIIKSSISRLIICFFTLKQIDTNFLISYVVFVSTSSLLRRALFSWCPFQSLLLRQNPCFIRRYPMLPRVLRAVPRVVRAWGGVPVWLGGVCRLLRGVIQACILTCYPDTQFRVPARLPFPRGTGELSSADHLWVGPCNGDCDEYVYSPP